MFGRNGEAPLRPRAPHAGDLRRAVEAVRIATRYMMPVILLATATSRTAPSRGRCRTSPTCRGSTWSRRPDATTPMNDSSAPYQRDTARSRGRGPCRARPVSSTASAASRRTRDGQHLLRPGQPRAHVADARREGRGMAQDIAPLELAAPETAECSCRLGRHVRADRGRRGAAPALGVEWPRSTCGGSTRSRRTSAQCSRAYRAGDRAGAEPGAAPRCSCGRSTSSTTFVSRVGAPFMVTERGHHGAGSELLSSVATSAPPACRGQGLALRTRGPGRKPRADQQGFMSDQEVRWCPGVATTRS